MILQIRSLKELLWCLVGAAVARQANVSRAHVLRESLPATHSIDNVVVTMDARIDTLLPLAVLFAVITTRLRIEGL